jgi:hypothetical protein
MNAFISYVFEGDGNIEELERMCKTGEPDEWTVDRRIRPGDKIAFYCTRPVAAFVAIGTAVSHSRPATPKDSRDGFWGQVRVDKVLDRLALRDARILFPKWAWLKKCQTTPSGGVRVPDAFQTTFLRELERRAATAPPDEPETDLSNDEPIDAGAGFGTDPEHNKEVEAAAVRAVWDRFEQEGWEVQDRQADKIGYDLLCRHDDEELHVEVKGVSGSKMQFIITRQEVKCARADPYFLLSVVTDALSGEPAIHDFTGNDLASLFDLEPVAYTATEKESVQS